MGLLRGVYQEAQQAAMLISFSDCTVILDNFFQYPYINQIDLHRKVTWCDKSVFYQIFVDRFHIGETKKIRII